MSRDQLEDVAAMLRHSRSSTEATLEDMRAAFEAAAGPPPAGLEAREMPLGDRPALRLRPTGGGARGLLLYLHGGGYAIGSARTGARLAATIARRLDATALSLDYRLAPEHPFPAAVDDAFAAYRALLEVEVPERLLIGGDSAGGGLALATLVRARDAGLPMPAATVLFSPWTDLTASGASMRSRDGVDPMLTPGGIRAEAVRYLDGADPSLPLASPMFADLRGAPPMLIQVGSRELLLDDAVGLAARAAHGDVDVTLEVVANAPHVFQAWEGLLDDADEALDRAATFLVRRLPPTPARPR